MLPVLTGEAPTPRTEMYWKRREREAARVGHWKWIKNASGEFLFNVKNDLAESNNLADSKPTELEKMRNHFANWHREMAEAEQRGPFRDD